MTGSGRFFKVAAFACALFFFLAAAACPALAKGFSTGGRAGFSSAGKSFSSGRGYSSGGRSFASPAPSSRTGTAAPSSTGGRSLAGGASGGEGASAAGGANGTSGAAGEASGLPSRESYAGGRESFSTPRQANPPAMYQDYSTGGSSYTTGRPSYSTGRSSYSGGGFPDLGKTRYPAKPPVGVFGPAPQPPEYYHDYYWSLPFLMRLFFCPAYYWTPWGYHFFAPRLLTWLLLFCLLGLGALSIAERARRR